MFDGIIEGRRDNVEPIVSPVCINPSDVTGMCSDPDNPDRTIIAEQSYATGETLLYCVPMPLEQVQKTLAEKTRVHITKNIGAHRDVMQCSDGDFRLYLGIDHVEGATDHEIINKMQAILHQVQNRLSGAPVYVTDWDKQA